MVEVTWTHRARKDLDAISAFIAESSPYYAQRTEVGILERTLVLEEHPLIGHPVQEVKDPGIREIAYGSYRIIYWVAAPGRLSVITVVHGKRRITRTAIRSRLSLE